MPDKKMIQETNEIGKLSNELMYRRYLMNKGKIQELFQKMTLQEYIALYMISPESECSPDREGKTYLKDLSEKMQLTVRQTSKVMERLRDRGLILWSYDGNGSQGTYVTITETGKKLYLEQETILKDCYGKVIENFGKENLVLLLKLMKQLDTLVYDEIKEMGEVYDNDRDDEYEE